jgi:hypothetical protein
LLDEHREDAARRLTEYESIRSELRGEGGGDVEYRLLTVSAGIHAARAAITWASP